MVLFIEAIELPNVVRPLKLKLALLFKIRYWTRSKDAHGFRGIGMNWPRVVEVKRVYF